MDLVEWELVQKDAADQDQKPSTNKPMPDEVLQFEDNGENGKESKADQEILTKKNVQFDGIKLWKWSFTGVPAVCTFGAAAATVCIIIYSNHKKKRNQKIQLQICNDDEVRKEKPSN